MPIGGGGGGGGWTTSELDNHIYFETGLVIVQEQEPIFTADFIQDYFLLFIIFVNLFLIFYFFYKIFR